MRTRLESILLPLAVAFGFVTVWHFAVQWTGSDIFPTPRQVLSGTWELVDQPDMFILWFRLLQFLDHLSLESGYHQ